MSFSSFLAVVTMATALVLPGNARAKTVSLTPDGTAAYAVRHNPALAAARLRIAEARGRLVNSGRLANPEFEAEYMQNTRTPERSATVGLMQRFPLTGRLRLERAVSRAELAAAEAEVADVARRTAGEAKLQAVRILASQAHQSLRQRQIGNSRQLADFTRTRAAAGEIALTDASQMELETRQLEAEILALRVEETALIGQLKPVLGLDRRDTLVITGTLKADVDLTERIDRPDLRAARANIDAALHSADLARAQKWEDIGVGVSAEFGRMMDEPMGLSNESSIGFGVSIPLPIWNDNRGRVMEAEALAVRRRLEQASLQNDISGEIAAVRAERSTLRELLGTLDRDLLPAATQLEEELQKAQAAGQAPLVEVLRARDRRLLLERQRIDALRELNLATVRHEIATGRVAPALSTRPSK